MCLKSIPQPRLVVTLQHVTWRGAVIYRPPSTIGTDRLTSMARPPSSCVGSLSSRRQSPYRLQGPKITLRIWFVHRLAEKSWLGQTFETHLRSSYVLPGSENLSSSHWPIPTASDENCGRAQKHTLVIYQWSNTIRPKSKLLQYLQLTYTMYSTRCLQLNERVQR